MNTQMSHDNQQFIEQLVATGRYASRDEAINEAVELLKRDMHPEGNGQQPSEDLASWTARFNTWVASHADVRAVADDDRESIYAGRGE